MDEKIAELRRINELQGQWLAEVRTNGSGDHSDDLRSQFIGLQRDFNKKYNCNKFTID